MIHDEIFPPHPLAVGGSLVNQSPMTRCGDGGWLDWWVCINCQLAHTFVAKIGLGILLEASSICGGSFEGTWCGSDGMPWFLSEISFRHPLIRIVHDMQFNKSKPLLLSQGALTGPDCKNLQEAATTILKTRSQSWMHLADFFRYAGFLFTAFWHHIIFMLSVMFSFFFSILYFLCGDKWQVLTKIFWMTF